MTPVPREAEIAPLSDRRAERERRLAERPGRPDGDERLILGTLHTFLSERAANARRIEMLRDRVAMVALSGGLGLVAFLSLRFDNLRQGTLALGAGFVVAAGALAAFAVLKYHQRAQSQHAAATVLRAEVNAICVRQTGFDVAALDAAAFDAHEATQSLAPLRMHVLWIGLSLATIAAGVVLLALKLGG